MRAVVAIVGRPNVGKSTLFNRLVGRRRAIVHDSPGVTRDRIFALAPLQEKTVWLIDTGGLQPEGKDEMSGIVGRQVALAAEEASLLLVVFDGRAGLTPEDQEVVSRLRPIGKPMIAVINKIDTNATEFPAGEFHRLGFETLVEISAEHNRGIDELRSVIQKNIPASEETEPAVENPDTPEIAFIGRPNVGKSSLINAILKEQRLAVSDIPGTTRDVIDTPVEYGGASYLLLDTAGIRRRGKVTDTVEHFSAVRSLRAIDRADVVVLVADATDLMTTQDERIAAAAVEAGAGLLVAVNKWDLVEDHPSVRKDFREELYYRAPFLHFADVRFLSAKTGKGVDGLLPAARQIWRNLKKVFQQAELDEVFRETYDANPPSGKKGFRLRIDGMTSAQEEVPAFFIWCSDPRRIDTAYERYWRNALGEKLKLAGVPLRVIFRRRAKLKKRPGRGSRKTKSSRRSRSR